MKIKTIRKIEPLESNCISVDSHDKLFAIGEQGNLLTHNSVAQQNIIISTLLRPEHWVLLGIDLKRVELTRFRKYGVKVATDLETAVEFLRFAQAVMMKRYERMEEVGVNDFEDLDEPMQALMVMIDEAGELLSPTGAKALSENTIIPLAYGAQTLLKEIKVGDVLLDNYGNPTTVTNKYEPESQAHYKMKIVNDNTKKSEEFISGEEHFWVVYLANPDNSIEGPYLLETKKLHELIEEEKAKPADKQRKLKIKKMNGKPTELEDKNK